MGAFKLDSAFITRKLGELPSLPGVVYELSRVINDPMSSTQEVEHIMAQDIGMTTRVLKLANSAYYAIPGGVSSLSRAIAFIGFDTVHQLVLSASIIDALNVKNSSAFDIGEFWKHSIGVGIAAETIAKHIQLHNAGDLFTCGLVHDMGKVALLLVAPEQLLETIEHAEKNKQTYYEYEIAAKLTSHAEIGHFLADKWKLPRTIQVASRYHHELDPSKRINLSADLHTVIDIVILANLLVHALKFGNSGHQKVLGAPNELLGRLMIHPQGDMPGIIKTIRANLEKAQDFIRTISGKGA